MRLPFSEADFLALFAAFNLAFWPALTLLWLASALVAIRLARGRATGREVAGLLALHWAWSGLAYHLLFFSRINPAAFGFAAFFVLQAGLLAREWRRGAWVMDGGALGRRVLGWALLLAALLYPLLVMLDGHRLPAAPAAGVPCPSTLFTAGALLLARGWPRAVGVIPAGWSLVGGSAAMLLGMTADVLLFVAGGALGAASLSRRRPAASLRARAA